MLGWGGWLITTHCRECGEERRGGRGCHSYILYSIYTDYQVVWGKSPFPSWASLEWCWRELRRDLLLALHHIIGGSHSNASYRNNRSVVVSVLALAVRNKKWQFWQKISCTRSSINKHRRRTNRFDDRPEHRHGPGICHALVDHHHRHVKLLSKQKVRSSSQQLRWWKAYMYYDARHSRSTSSWWIV